MTSREQVLQQALALTIEDQALLLDSLEQQLLSQLDFEASAGDGFAGSELLAELRRRSTDFSANPSTARPVEQVMKELRQRQQRETQS